MKSDETTLLGDFVFNRLPFLGQPYDRKEEDPDEKQPQLVYTPHVKVFDFTKDEDLREYENIWADYYKQTVIIGTEERQYDPTSKNWRVLLRWVSQHYTNP
jgi:hypothetical protein